MLAFAEEAAKKVLASLDMCLHLERKLLKIVGKLRKVLAFAEGVVEKVLARLETGWQFRKEQLKKCWQA